MTPRRRETDLVRAYVITGGRAYPSREALDPAALVEPGDLAYPAATTDPDRTRVLEVCRGGSLSVAEVAAHTRLPLTVTMVVVGDLLNSGHLQAKQPVLALAAPDHNVLQEVLDGLRRLVV